MSQIKEVKRLYDEYGAVLVLEDGLKRYLSFGDGYEQSSQYKLQPWVPAHEYIAAMLTVLVYSNPKNITLLGLGAGVLAGSLHQQLKTTTIKAIELRPNIIRMAKRYFELPDSDRMEIVEGDALDYIAVTADKKVDLLFSDLFGPEGLDLRQLDKDFFAHCHRCLKPSGWLVLNCWAEHKKTLQLKSVIAPYFPIIYELKTSTGNWVLLLSKKEVSDSQAVLEKRGQKISREWQLPLSAYHKKIKRLVV